MSFLLPLVAFLACGPSFYDVQQEDTIEAYEAWLVTASPADPNYTRAEFQLEELYLKHARAEKSLAAYDRYLERYPKGNLREKALAERVEFLWGWAQEENTAAGWQSFLDEYPRAEKKKKQEARRRLVMLEYTAQLEIGEISIVPINLAEDPDGPKNGFDIRADIVNKTGKVVEYLNMEVHFHAADGSVVGQKRYPWVAPNLPGYVPVEEEFKVPVKIDETRAYSYWADQRETGDWAKKASLHPVSIRFAGPDSRD